VVATRVAALDWRWRPLLVNARPKTRLKADD
jgi:hypothetical protein